MALFDGFLKLDGIPGESADDKHKGEIKIDSFSCGAVQTGTMAHGGGGGAGKAAIQDAHFTGTFDKSGPKLFQACCSGEHVKDALLTLRKAGGVQEEFLKITLGDIIVSSHQVGGSSEGSIPNQQFSLNFSKIDFEYKEQQSKGSLGGQVKAGWDVKANKKT